MLSSMAPEHEFSSMVDFYDPQHGIPEEPGSSTTGTLKTLTLMQQSPQPQVLDHCMPKKS